MSGDTDREKWAAYRETVLEFAGADAPRVDLRRPDAAALAALLRAEGVALPVAILTPENPRGRNSEDAPTSRESATAADRNDERLHALLLEFQQDGRPFARVDGVAPDGSYRERCVALTLDVESARLLALRLRQLAFFWFDGTRVWLEPAASDHPRETLP